MTSARQIRECAEPIIQCAEYDTLAHVLDTLNQGQPMALYWAEHWHLLLPEAAAGYPVSRRVIDLPSKEALTVHPDDSIHETLIQLAKANTLYGLVVEDKQLLGMVSENRLLEQIVYQSYQAVQLGDWLQESLQATGTLVWRLALPEKDEDLSLTLPGIEIYGPVETLLGYSSNTFSEMAQTWLDNVHPDDRTEIERITGNLFKQGGTAIRTYRFRHLNGHWIWLQEQIQTEQDSTGRVIALYSRATDATEIMQEKEQISNLNQALLSFTADAAEEGLEQMLNYVCQYLNLEGGWVLGQKREAHTYEVMATHSKSTNVQTLSTDSSALPCNCCDLFTSASPTKEMTLQFCNCTLTQHQQRHVLTAPLIVEDHILGGMGFLVPDNFQILENTRFFLQNIASTISFFLSRIQLTDSLKKLNNRLKKRITQHNFELETLYELSQQLGSALNYTALFHLIFSHLHQAVKYDMAAALILDHQPHLFIQSNCPVSTNVQEDIQERLLKNFYRLSQQPLTQKISIFKNSIQTRQAPR